MCLTLGKLALLGLVWLMSQMQGRQCPKSTSRLIQMDGGIAGMEILLTLQVYNGKLGGGGLVDGRFSPYETSPAHHCGTVVE